MVSATCTNLNCYTIRLIWLKIKLEFQKVCSAYPTHITFNRNLSNSFGFAKRPAVFRAVTREETSNQMRPSFHSFLIRKCVQRPRNIPSNISHDELPSPSQDKISNIFTFFFHTVPCTVWLPFYYSSGWRYIGTGNNHHGHRNAQGYSWTTRMSDMFRALQLAAMHTAALVREFLRNRVRNAIWWL